jgi:hypothetical protein
MAIENKWHDSPELLDKMDIDRTIVLFDNGEIRRYNEEFPFSQAIAFFELPEYKPDDINPNSFEAQGYPPY